MALARSEAGLWRHVLTTGKGQPGSERNPRVHASALPSAAPPEALRIRPDAHGELAVDPARAGWRYLSFRVIRLLPGSSVAIGRPGHETVVVNLVGDDARLTIDGAEDWPVRGRESVFDRPPSALYLPADRPAVARLEAATGSASTVLAIAEAPGRPALAARLQPVAIEPDDVRLETRGSGHATRQIRHLVTPEFPADRLLIVEVVTPAGNWSSWPPHKHDVDAMPDEAVLEEIYHYRFRRSEAWAIQRLYRRPERGLPPRDALWAVRDGEVVLVTDGYHPFSATIADDAYYLNALAGDRRTMACSFDPDFV
jgi:5-deoxy-glucuronate isomerase